MLKALNSIKLLLFIALSVIILNSCKDESLPPADFKTSYFPLKLHSTLIYKVDSTHYSEFNHTVITYSFEIKDSVVRDISEGNNQTFVIYRYKKTGNEWVYQKLFTRTIVSQRAEEFVDNQRFVRLTFPPQKNKSWKGNLYNNLDLNTGTVYTIKSLDSKREINSIALDSTLVVEEMQDINLIRKDYAIAIYAKNIGLVKRMTYAVDTEISDSTKIIDGYKSIMELKSFR